MSAEIELTGRLDGDGKGRGETLETSGHSRGGDGPPPASKQRRSLADKIFARKPRDKFATPAASSSKSFWQRRGWHSPLTRRILAINVLTLVIPILGLLHLDQYRQTLISTEIQAMKVQARAFSLSLGSTAAVGGDGGDESLFPDITRSLVRVLLSDITTRARTFAKSGELIADSFRLAGPGGLIEVVELPPPEARGLVSELGRLYDRALNWLPGTSNLPLYKEAAEQRADHYEEVVKALSGESAGMVRLDSKERLMLSVAVPVQRYRQILGALMLSKDGGEIAVAVRDRRRDILVVFGIALTVTVLLSIYLASTLARPIRRLAEAADQVRRGKGRRVKIPDFSHRADEIGDLSEALSEMTEALWTRLDAIEHFAADVAHEIKNPLTSLRSAVETVARIEDPDQQKKLMSIILDDVQRLDRLISDISDASRLDAELSRAESELVDAGQLLEALAEVHEASLGEKGPRFQVAVPSQQRLLISGLEGRLGQVFRNLLNNAISFSPPGGTIYLAARREQDWVVITIADEGPGLPPEKLENIFDRFYSERPEGEKFGTHSGLGLSISRQIIDAHGGTIRAENRHDAQDKIIGASFIIRLPAE